MKKILITGANFNNKGAQSMMFTLVNAIKQLNFDNVIYFSTLEKYDEDEFAFIKIHYEYAKNIILKPKSQLIYKFKIVVEDFIRFFFRKRNNLFSWHFNEAKKILNDIDLILDISGFAIGNQWPVEYQESYLDNIRIAKKYNIPIILLPQSFGPFDYKEKDKYLLKELSELLSYSDIIFAREKDGYDALINTFHLTNVKLSSDLVLQSKGIDKSLIYTQSVELNLPKVNGESVAVIPNNQCFTRGDVNKICNYYRVMIDELLSAGKEVYIFRHSGEDLPHCRTIYNMYSSNDRVHLLENDFSCIEYDEFIKNFQFIICSRFHGIVHAYRNAVPAIVLGWAVKYKELTESVSQNQYMFDIVDGNIEDSKVKEIVDNMLTNYSKESKIIRERVEVIQQDNCFEVLKNYIS